MRQVKFTPWFSANAEQPVRAGVYEVTLEPRYQRQFSYWSKRHGWSVVSSTPSNAHASRAWPTAFWVARWRGLGERP